jgi:hypothetical protein
MHKFKAKRSFTQEVRKTRRSLFHLLILLVVTVSPIQAQPATPQPGNPTISVTSTDNSWIHDLAELVQGIGTSGTLALIMSAGFVLLIYRTYKPMLDAAREDRAELRAERDERQKERDERERERQERGLITQKMATVLKEQGEDRRTVTEQRQKQTEVLDGMLNAITELKASVDTTDQRDAARNSTVREINQHTSKTFDDAIQSLNSAREDVRSAAETMRTVPTVVAFKEILDEKFKPVLKQIDELTLQIIQHKKGDTGRLPSLPSNDDPPSSTSRTPGGPYPAA